MAQLVVVIVAVPLTEPDIPVMTNEPLALGGVKRVETTPPCVSPEVEVNEPLAALNATGAPLTKALFASLTVAMTTTGRSQGGVVLDTCKVTLLAAAGPLGAAGSATVGDGAQLACMSIAAVASPAAVAVSLTGRPSVAGGVKRVLTTPPTVSPDCVVKVPAGALNSTETLLAKSPFASLTVAITTTGRLHGGFVVEAASVMEYGGGVTVSFGLRSRTVPFANGSEDASEIGGHRANANKSRHSNMAWPRYDHRHSRAYNLAPTSGFRISTC